MDEQGFLKLVRHNPDSDEPRLLLADWYEEQGDARGEFIRLQCELFQQHPAEEGVADKEARVRQLLHKHQSRWIKQLPKIAGLTWGSFTDAATEARWESGRHYFRRGMVELVTLNKRQIRDNMSALKNYGIASCPTIGSEMPDYVWQLQNDLPHLRSVELFQKQQPLALLGQLEQFSRLEALTVNECNLGPGDVAELQQLNLPHLRSLDLHFNDLGPSIGELALAPWMKGLRWLDIGLNDLGAQWSHDGTTEFAATLGKQEALSDLAWLDIRSNRLRDPHLIEFLRGCQLKRLVGLNLAGNQFFNSVHRILRTVFPSLRGINFSNCDLKAEDVRKLFGSKECPRLVSLNLGNNSELDDSVVEAICESSALSQLAYLNLPRTGISSSGLQMLIDSQSPHKLKWLNIGDMEVQPEQLKALRKRFRGAVKQQPYH